MSNSIQYGSEHDYPLTKPRQEFLPNLVNIRTDLQHLFFALGGNPQTSLSELLQLARIKRAIEFGSGVDLRAANTLSEVEGLELVISDPEYKVELPNLDGLNQVSSLSLSTEEVASLVKNGSIKPFDLVFSKGLLSPGALVDSQGDLKEWHEKAFEYTQSMTKCLSSNPNAILSASSKHGGSLLMLFDKDIETLGLQKKYGFLIDQTNNNIGKQYYDRLVSHNLIPAGTSVYEFLALTRKII